MEAGHLSVDSTDQQWHTAGKGQLFHWDGDMTIAWPIFFIYSGQMLPQLEKCVYLQVKHFEKDVFQVEKLSSLCR